MASGTYIKRTSFKIAVWSVLLAVAVGCVFTLIFAARTKLYPVKGSVNVHIETFRDVTDENSILRIRYADFEYYDSEHRHHSLAVCKELVDNSGGCNCGADADGYDAIYYKDGKKLPDGTRYLKFIKPSDRMLEKLKTRDFVRMSRIPSGIAILLYGILLAVIIICVCRICSRAEYRAKCREILNGIEKSDDKHKYLDRHPYWECEYCPFYFNNHCPVANYDTYDNTPQKKNYEQLWEQTKKINKFFEKDISCYDNDPLEQRKIMFS